MTVAALFTGLKDGDRRALAKAITLVESTRAADRGAIDELLNLAAAHAGGAARVGISGSPGAGKSTLIESLGLNLVGRGQRVAVLAIDPSSQLTGGSVLGDKTRMAGLAAHAGAFVRPSPSAGALGGVAERTREVMLLCEAASFDLIIVESVGVGQSEVALGGMVDLFAVLQIPNAGDDLQAIKRGVLEHADLLVVNKADLDESGAALAAQQLVHVTHQPPVCITSALTGAGVTEFADMLLAMLAERRDSGACAKRRQEQAVRWMWDSIRTDLLHQFQRNPGVQAVIDEWIRAVRGGSVAPSVAARELLRRHAAG
jgi:LAO/AO transport system kinase